MKTILKVGSRRVVPLVPLRLRAFAPLRYLYPVPAFRFTWLVLGGAALFFCVRRLTMKVR